MLIHLAGRRLGGERLTPWGSQTRDGIVAYSPGGVRGEAAAPWGSQTLCEPHLVFSTFGCSDTWGLADHAGATQLLETVKSSRHRRSHKYTFKCKPAVQRPPPSLAVGSHTLHRILGPGTGDRPAPEPSESPKPASPDLAPSLTLLPVEATRKAMALGSPSASQLTLVLPQGPAGRGRTPPLVVCE